MKIAVCLKQIPASSDLQFDPRSKRLQRAELPSRTNPLDLVALGHALTLKPEGDAQITAITMGPESARAVLEDGLRRGADRGIHLLDRRFAGADTLATSRALADCLCVGGFDFVLLGRSTLDGATAQVGPQVAELLAIDQITNVVELHLGHEGLLTASRANGCEEEVWEVRAPAVITVSAGRAPAVRNGRIAAIDTVDVDRLGGSAVDYGTRGSPTFVVEVRPPERPRANEWAASAEAAIPKLLSALADVSNPRPHEPPPRQPGTRHEIWVLGERNRAGLTRGTFEALACAAPAARAVDAAVVALLLCSEPGDLAVDLARRGADQVLVVRDPSLREFATAPFVAAFATTLSAHRPRAVVAPWSAQTCDYVPRVAARLGLGLTGDFVRLEVRDPHEDPPELAWIKPVLAGGRQAVVVAHTRPALGTLRPSVWQPLEPRLDAAPRVRVVDLARAVNTNGLAGSCHRSRSQAAHARLPAEAPVLIGLGGGLHHRTAEAARSLAAELGATVLATKMAVEVGLAPPSSSLASHAPLAPRLYVGLGVHDVDSLCAISGAGNVVVADAGGSAREGVDLAVAACPAELVESLTAAIAAPTNQSSRTPRRR